MFVKNVKPAVVVLNGQTVIPPLAVVEVDGENSGVQSLIESGHLVEASEAETPETTETPEKPEKPAGKNK